MPLRDHAFDPVARSGQRGGRETDPLPTGREAVSVAAACIKCGGRFHAPVRQAGKLVKCPTCGEAVRIPAPAAEKKAGTARTVRAGAPAPPAERKAGTERIARPTAPPAEAAGGIPAEKKAGTARIARVPPGTDPSKTLTPTLDDRAPVSPRSEAPHAEYEPAEKKSGTRRIPRVPAGGDPSKTLTPMLDDRAPGSSRTEPSQAEYTPAEKKSGTRRIPREAAAAAAAPAPASLRTPKAQPGPVRWDQGLGAAFLAQPPPSVASAAPVAPARPPAAAPRRAAAPRPGVAAAAAGDGDGGGTGFWAFVAVGLILAAFVGGYLWFSGGASPAAKTPANQPAAATAESLAFLKAVAEAESLCDGRSWKPAEAAAVKAAGLAPDARGRARALALQGRATLGRKAEQAAAGGELAPLDADAIAVFDKALAADPTYLQPYETLFAMWIPALASAEADRKSLEDYVRQNPDDRDTSAKLRSADTDASALRTRLQKLVGQLSRAEGTMTPAEKARADQMLAGAKQALE